MVIERRRKRAAPSLPEEMIEEILKRLPVRSLVRFSCTCKRWRSLIFSDPKFNKAHIDLAKRPSWKFQELRHDSNTFGRTVDCDCNTVNMLPIKILTRYRRAVLGSCNGLLFVSGWGVLGSNEPVYALWNPYTNSIRKIDGVVGIIVFSKMYGLSYDHASDDYKAVIIAIGFRSSYIFSLRRNSWKKLSDLPFDISNMCTTALSYDRFGITPDNGICYWQIIKDSLKSSSIICFDPGMEKFKDVPLPDEWRCSSSTGRFFQIGALDGYLSLIHMNIIWVMKEYGWWSKMHVLELNCIERMIEINRYKPLGYNSTKDQVVMIAYNRRGFSWYLLIADVKEGVVRIPRDTLVRNIDFSSCYIVPYTESLLCPWL